MTGVASCWFIEEGSRELQVARLKLAGKAIILKAIDQAKGSYTEAAKLLQGTSKLSASLDTQSEFEEPTEDLINPLSTR